MNHCITMVTSTTGASRPRDLPPPPPWSRWLHWMLMAMLLAGSGIHRETTAAPSFRSQILPILSQNCFRCHGPDEATRKGCIRLDLKENALASKDWVAIITPGDSTRSELIRRIQSRDPDEQMPPPDSNLTLSPQ